MHTVKTTLEHVKSTKGTHVYADPENAAVKTLYVQREAMPTNPPKRITITVEAEPA